MKPIISNNFLNDIVFPLLLGFVVLLADEAQADLILTYDSPTLQLEPGQSTQIGATLTNTSGSGSFITDSDGVQTIDQLFMSRFTVGKQEQAMYSFASTHTSPFLAANSAFIVTTPNPMENLNIAGGATNHLILGTLTIDPTAPAGFYTGEYGIDVGIFRSDNLLLPFPGGVFLTIGNPFAPPDIDAGILSVNVTAAPIPSAMWLFSSVIGGFLVQGRRKRR